MTKEMTLDKFMEISSAWSNGNGSWSVEITLANMQKSILTIDDCYSEFQAKERAFIYLLDRIENQ